MTDREADAQELREKLEKVIRRYHPEDIKTVDTLLAVLIRAREAWDGKTTDA